VGSTAAQILGHGIPSAAFLKHHSFDMSYYNNVPDVVWKSTPEMYRQERAQHFVDLEIFNKQPDINKQPWASDRVVFQKKFTDIPEAAGWAFWRIEELNKKLEKATTELKKSKNSKSEVHRKWQEEWILTAGIMGHYVADLSQPLHCTENYDGEKTDQKGIHFFFEEVMVDEMAPADLEGEVYKQVHRQWAAFTKKNEKKSVFELARELCNDSYKELPKLLALDKKIGRNDLKNALRSYRPLIVSRLVIGSLYLAEIWRRQLGFEFNNNKFYFFDAKPEYIKPPSRARD